MRRERDGSFKDPRRETTFLTRSQRIQRGVTREVGGLPAPTQSASKRARQCGEREGMWSSVDRPMQRREVGEGEVVIEVSMLLFSTGLVHGRPRRRSSLTAARREGEWGRAARLHRSELRIRLRTIGLGERQCRDCGDGTRERESSIERERGRG